MKTFSVYCKNTSREEESYTVSLHSTKEKAEKSIQSLIEEEPESYDPNFSEDFPREVYLEVRTKTIH